MTETKEETKKNSGQGDWWRGDHCNFLLGKSPMIAGLPQTVEEYVLKGLVPDAPFITKSHGVAAFGSCFASGIYHRLLKWGYNVDPLAQHTSQPHHTHVTYHRSGMVNVYSILQQFQWAYGEKDFTQDIWFDNPARPASREEEIRNNTQDFFNNVDVFIITLGLSEIWFNKETGDPFWRAVPEDIFDPSKHGFRICSHTETKQALTNIVSIITKYRPQAKVIFSVSPVRLKATFRPIGCFPANSVSKAIIRSALDEMIRENQNDNLFYWPSYEIVTDIFPDPWTEDNRHPQTHVIELVMNLFKKYYLVD